MPLKNTVPALIKMPGQDPMWVNVKREISYHPANHGKLIMYIAKGWRRRLKKTPMKFMEKTEIPVDLVHIYPQGTSNGVLNPHSTMFVCGVRDDCHGELSKKNEHLKEKLGNITTKYNDEKKKLEDKIKSLETKYDEIIANQAMSSKK